MSEILEQTAKAQTTQSEKNKKQIRTLNEKITEFKDKITGLVTECNQVYLTTHMSPDYDAIASLGALGLICKKLKKAPYIIVDQKDYDSLPQDRAEMFDKLKEKFVIINKQDFENNKVENSLLIMVDVNKGFMTPMKNNYKDFSNIIVIDHHLEDENTIKTKNKLILKEVSSCSEIMYWLLKKYKIKSSDPIYYTYLLTGIALDTDKGNKNVYASTESCRGELKINGADDMVVSSYFSLDFEQDRKIQKLIDETIWKTFRYGIIVGNKEEYTKEEIAKAADYLLKYTCEAAIVCARNKDGSYDVSARSNKGDVDIAFLMHELNNGGGNFNSASCPAIFVDADDLDLQKEILIKRIYDIIYHRNHQTKRKRYKVVSRK